MLPWSRKSDERHGFREVVACPVTTRAGWSVALRDGIRTMFGADRLPAVKRQRPGDRGPS